ncbi:MAG: O-antigen ligase family protein [Acholeplasmataceae bacterium]|nr:O-antigen ligase family protein [Acholeplasmataceae bacterium]
MNWLKEQKQQFQQLIQEFKTIKTMRQFFDFFTEERLSKLAVFFVILWGIIPILLMFFSLFYDRSSVFSFMFNSSKLTIIWFMLMQQIGYIGMVIVILLIIKSLFNRKLKNIPLKSYVLSHLVEILLILFLLWSLFSSFFSNDLSQSFFGSDYRKDGWFSYLAYGGFFGLGYLVIRKKSIVKYLKILVGVGSFLGLLLIINHQGINDILTFHYQSTVFYNPNHMGYYLVIVILSSAYLAISESRINLGKVIYYMLFTLLVVSLITNGSFGPYIAVSFGLLFLMIMTLYMNKSMLIHAMSISVLFIVITLIMNFDTNFLTQETTHLSEGVTDIIENNDEAGAAGSGRWSLWTNGIEFMIDEPIVGYGIENLEQAYLEEGILQDRPHNELIQIGASIGIPALILYGFSMFFHFFEFLKQKKKNSSLMIGLFMIVFGYLVSSMFGNSMFYTTPFFMIVFGISRGLFQSNLHEM